MRKNILPITTIDRKTNIILYDIDIDKNQ